MNQLIRDIEFTLLKCGTISCLVALLQSKLPAGGVSASPCGRWVEFLVGLLRLFPDLWGWGDHSGTNLQ